MTVHEIRLVQSGARWRAVCSCGSYKSSSYTFKGYAESAGGQHIRSKRQAS